ncbi:MAG: hypothetical protein [Microviridae sp.]|nr:MAG: hypothetical protein [Microviridae sp.]
MKKLPKYKTSDNAQLFPKIGEINSGEIMTIPNDTYSLRDIVEKFSREYPKALQRTGYYDYDENAQENFDDIDETRNADFDYVDAMELKENIKEKRKPKEKKEQNMITFKQKTIEEEIARNEGTPEQITP